MKFHFYFLKIMINNNETALKIINYKSENESIENFYWDLIDYLLKLIKLSNFFKNKEITIAFDQYNQSVDKNNKYKYLCETYLYNSKTFSFITLSSLNDSDIRVYKEEKLSKKYYFENPPTEIYFDLNIPELSDENKLNEENKMDIINEEYEEDENVSFIEDESEASNEEEEQEEQEEMSEYEKIIYENEEEEDYDKALELLGSTIKYYNILKYIKYKEKKKYRLSSFLIGTKRHIKKKILKFYKCKNIKDFTII